MSRKIFFTGLALFAFGVLVFWSAHYASVKLADNSVADLPESLELGDVEAGTVVDGIVRVANGSRDALKVSDFSTDCGCVRLVKIVDGAETVLEKEEVVSPSSELNIRIRFVAFPEPDGWVRHQVNFRTNRSRQPHWTVAVRCRAMMRIYLIPHEVHFGVIQTDHPATQSVRIVDCRPAPQRGRFELRTDHPGVRTTPPVLSTIEADHADLPAGVAVYRVGMTVTASETSGAWKCGLTISDGNELLAQALCTAIVRDPVMLVPSSAVLPRVDDEEPYTFCALCMSSESVDLVPDQVPTGFRVSVAGKRVQITTSADMLPANGTYDFTFAARSADGLVRKLRLPLTVYRSGIAGRDQ